MRKRCFVAVTCIMVLITCILTGFTDSLQAKESNKIPVYTEEKISIKPLLKVDPAVNNPKRIVISDQGMQLYDWKQKSAKKDVLAYKSRLYQYNVKGKKMQGKEINLCKKIKTEVQRNMAQMQDKKGNLHCLYSKETGKKTSFCYVVCDKKGKCIQKMEVRPEKIIQKNERIHFPEDDTTDSMRNNMFDITGNKVRFGYTVTSGDSVEADCRLGAVIAELDIKKETLKTVMIQKGNLVSVGADQNTAVFYDVNKKEYRMYNCQNKKLINTITVPNTDQYLCGDNPRTQYVNRTLYYMDGYGIYKAGKKARTFTKILDFSQKHISLCSEEQARKICSQNDRKAMCNNYYPYTLFVVSDKEFYVGGTTVIEERGLEVIYHYTVKK